MKTGSSTFGSLTAGAAAGAAGIAAGEVGETEVESVAVSLLIFDWSFIRICDT